VTSTEIEEIENYMDLMSPLNSNYVTQNQLEKNTGNKLTEEEVEKIVERKLKSQKQKE